MSTIESFMKMNMVTASPDDTVAVVARRMQQADIGAVVLVEGGELAGLFSERDLLARVVAAGLDPATTPVRDVATTSLVTVTPDTTIKACAEKLRDHNVRHMPVIDGKKPVGILSARDFFGAVAARFEELIEQVRYDEQLRENFDPYDHMGGGYGK